MGGWESIEHSYNPSVVGYSGPSELELMLESRLFWFILGLVIYLIITLIVYVIFGFKKHEHPFIDALKISRIWGMIIVFILYNAYMIFIGMCSTCAYFSRQDDPMFKLMLLDIGFIVFMVIACIFYFKGKKNSINNKSE